MNLLSWVRAERGRASRLARDISVNPVMVSQWATGIKPVPIRQAAAIERATNGDVMRWDLRPDDWREIWPELETHPSAPREREAA